GAAPDVHWLIAARALQGAGGALLVPGSLALIGAAFGARERGRAIGTWSAFTAVTMGVGPVLGGWMVENVSWRWIFYVNLPLAALTLALLVRVPESRDPDAPRRMDLPGAVLATLGLGGLVLALVEAPRLGWTAPPILIGLIGGTLALAAFVAVEARSRAPMVPLSIFRSRTFSGANLVTLLLYAALVGVMFFLPFNLIGVQGWSATAAGAAFLPSVVLMTLLSRWSGGLVDRYGARLPLTVGPLVAAAGFALLARPGIGAGFWTGFFPAILLQGVGMAIAVAPLTTAVMGAVDARHAGVASGVNNAVSRAAGLLAIAGLGIVAQGAFGPALERRLEAAAVPAEVRSAVEAQRGRLAAAEAPRDASPALRRTVDRAVDEAFVEAFRWIAWIAAALAVLGAACAWVMIEPLRPAGDAGGGAPAG
ncbi:MAG TPA: MFS transporter, partial [Longimicrobium sp.]|nr:MFS transporter [Longimicrobium sp.]